MATLWYLYATKVAFARSRAEDDVVMGRGLIAKATGSTKTMRVSVLMLGVMVFALSLVQMGCPKKVQKAARKELPYGKNYKGWTKINKRKLISSNHGNTAKYVYSNSSAHKVFMGVKKMPYPEGAAFVVIHYNNDGEEQPYAYVMRKMGKDYDPDRGNWRYTIVRVSDWTIEQDGLLANCINCHKKGMQSDFVRLDRKLFQNNPF